MLVLAEQVVFQQERTLTVKTPPVAVTFTLRSMKPVSYTHLDVYKRQVLEIKT